MSPKVDRCPECTEYHRIDAEGQIEEHHTYGAEQPCTGSGKAPEPSTVDDYPEGFDHEPWVYNGGLPTLGKDR